MSSNPFDYVNQILNGKKNLIVDEITEKEYSPFLTNRSLSYHRDCVLFANEMNMRHFLDNKMQNDFLFGVVRKQKRSFNKWIKTEKNEDIDAVKKYFNFSTEKAVEALKILTKEQIEDIKIELHVGGLK
jgi:hypothetical protein